MSCRRGPWLGEERLGQSHHLARGILAQPVQQVGQRDVEGIGLVALGIDAGRRAQRRAGVTQPLFVGADAVDGHRMPGEDLQRADVPGLWQRDAVEPLLEHAGHLIACRALVDPLGPVEAVGKGARDALEHRHVQRLRRQEGEARAVRAGLQPRLDIDKGRVRVALGVDVADHRIARPDQHPAFGGELAAFAGGRDAGRCGGAGIGAAREVIDGIRTEGGHVVLS